MPIYVTKCTYFKEHSENHKICQIAARRSAGYTFRAVGVGGALKALKELNTMKPPKSSLAVKSLDSVNSANKVG